MITDKVDILIENGDILTIDPEMKRYKKGWIAIRDGSIIDMGDNPEKKRQYKPVRTLNAETKIVMPGFINTHTHIAMAYFKGLADDLPLHTWLTEHIWPKETAMINDEFVYHSSLHGIAELIKNGTVMFNDMYFRGSQTAKAALEAGVRAVIGEGILDFPVAGYDGSDSILKYSISLLDQLQDNHLIDVSLSPHSIYTCSPETLQKALEISDKYGVLLHTHLAETKKEFDDCTAKHGKTPTAYLNDLNFWSHKCIAAHSVWLTDEDIDILAEKKVNISINTKSNLKLASGFLPLKKLAAKGINLSLATDGVASNNNLSLIEEMSTTAKVHKALNNDPTFLPAAEIVKFATINAAKALGKEKLTGSLEIGKQADIITVETDKIETLPVYNPYSHIVYNLNSSSIKDVIINGKAVMQNRQLLTVDEQEIKERAGYYRKKMEE